MMRRVVAIVGPTASGKSALAQALAARLDGEVVSADSMQVYRGMNIGTGKVPVAERIVAHHCLDLVDPGEPYSAALFQAAARTAFDAIASRGRQSVLCGGTGFYVRAALDDFSFPPGEQVDNATRDRLLRFLDARGHQALWDELDAIDRESAQLIHPHDAKRVIRAFELIDGGTSYAVQHERLSKIPQKIDALFIGLDVDPGILGERIDARVDGMFEDGLVDEVQALLHHGFRSGVTAPQAIGYKEIVSALDGNITFDEARALVKTSSRRYAKRQRTWFKKDQRIEWLHADSADTDALLCQVLALIDRIDEKEDKEQR